MSTPPSRFPSRRSLHGANDPGTSPSSGVPSSPASQPTPPTVPPAASIPRRQAAFPTVTQVPASQPVAVAETPAPRPPAEPTRKKRPFFLRFLSSLLGVIGEVLITVGLFLLGYVAWQLWWTSVEVAPLTAARVEGFQSENPSPEHAGTPRYDDPPIMDQPAYLQTLGLLHVPRWDYMALPIVQGTTPEVLDTGNAGHYVETQLPGEIGNFAVAAHRRTYGNNFRRVPELQPGDQFVVETPQAYMVYEMRDHEIVLPSQYQVVLPVPNQLGAVPTERLMTMTTCEPEYNATHRWIVYSEFKFWTAKDDGPPQILLDKP